MNREKSKIVKIPYILFVIIYIISGCLSYISFCCKFFYKGSYGYMLGWKVGYSFITWWIGLLPITLSMILLFKNKIHKFFLVALIGCVLIFLHLLYIIFLVLNPPPLCDLYALGEGFYLGFASLLGLFVSLSIIFLKRKILLMDNS